MSPAPLRDKIMEHSWKIAAIALAVLLIRGCYKERENQKAVDSLMKYKHEAKFYKDKNNRLVAYNSVVELSNKDAKRYIDTLTRFLKELRMKDPQIVVKVTGGVRVDTIRVPFHDTLPCADFTKNIDLDSAYYTMAFTLTKKDFLINKVSFPNTQEIVLGTKRNGLFKRDSLILAVRNSNPYMYTSSIGALSVKPDPKWHDRLWFKGVLFAAGCLVGTKL